MASSASPHSAIALPLSGAQAAAHTPCPILQPFSPLLTLRQQLNHKPTAALGMTSPRRQHCATRAGARGVAGAHNCGAFKMGSLGLGQKSSTGMEWAAVPTGAAAAASRQSGSGTAALAAGGHIGCHVRCHAQAQEHGGREAVPSSLVLPTLASAEKECHSPSETKAGVAATTAAAIALLTASAAAAATVEGPEELPPVDEYTSGATPEEEEATPFQTAASVVLTGALTLLLIRTFRRRAAKAKETRMRSSVVDRLTPPSEVEKAKAALKAASAEEPASPPPTAFGAFSGAVMAGAITYVAYSFTIGVDENFAQQSISANYTIRNITITIRTIISGLGWLATGVFGANTLGLTLLAFQIALGLTPAERASAAAEESSRSSAAETAEADKMGGSLDSKPLPEESKEKSQQ